MPYYGYYGGYGDFFERIISTAFLLIPGASAVPVGAGAGQRKLQTVQRCCQPAASHRRAGGGGGAAVQRRVRRAH